MNGQRRRLALLVSCSSLVCCRVEAHSRGANDSNTFPLLRPSPLGRSLGVTKQQQRQQQSSLVDALEQLHLHHSDFGKRVRQQEEKKYNDSSPLSSQQQAYPIDNDDHYHVRVLATSVLASLIVLCASSWVQGEPLWQGVVHLFRDLQRTGVGILLLQLVSLWNSKISIRHILAYGCVLLTNPQFLWHLGTELVPQTAETIQTFVVSELWNRAFAKVFVSVGALFGGVLPFVATNWHIPNVAQHLLQRSVLRGTKRWFQRHLQAHVGRAVSVVYRYSVCALRNQFQLLYEHTK